MMEYLFSFLGDLHLLQFDLERFPMINNMSWYVSYYPELTHWPLADQVGIADT